MGKRVKNIEEANQRLIDIESEYICTEYAGNTSGKSTFHHTVCGCIWDTTLTSIVSIGTGCPRCANNEPIRTIEEANQRLADTEYICTVYSGNTQDKSTFHHPMCGHTWDTSLTHIVNCGTGCAKCAGNNPIKTIEEANQNLIDIGSECVCLFYAGKVRGQSVFRHVVCNNTWDASLSNIINNGTGCPTCAASSNGEMRILEWLSSKKLTPTIIQQYSPEWIGRKKYDFYIPSHNLIIEYHGKQHYEYNQFFHRNGIQDFIDAQQVDAYKKRMAIERGYNFLEISYADFDNIETLLKGILEL